jgi:neutral trehalase
MYLAYDRVHKRTIDQHPASGLIPLFCGAPDRQQADRIVQWLASPAFSGTPQHPAYLCPSYSTLDPRFDERRYWRGPVWININWLLYHGLNRYGFHSLAERIRSDSFELIRRYGFWEYYNPWKILPEGQTGGYGSGDFSWTAALAIDWLAGA